MGVIHIRTPRRDRVRIPDDVKRRLFALKTATQPRTPKNDRTRGKPELCARAAHVGGAGHGIRCSGTGSRFRLTEAAPRFRDEHGDDKDDENDELRESGYEDAHDHRGRRPHRSSGSVHEGSDTKGSSKLDCPGEGETGAAAEQSRDVSSLYRARRT